MDLTQELKQSLELYGKLNKIWSRTDCVIRLEINRILCLIDLPDGLVTKTNFGIAINDTKFLSGLKTSPELRYNVQILVDALWDIYK